MPKAETLYAALTPQEKKRFASLMKSHKRNSLQSLFNYIVRENNKGGEFIKEKAFAQTFGRKYSQEEDYLLRHELRLLVSELHDFLIDTENKRELESNINLQDTMLLQGLLNRKCFEELEQFFSKSLASSIERLNFEQARRQSDIYFRYLIFHREITPEILEKARSVMFDQIDILKTLYRTSFVLNQNNRSVCEGMLAMANKPVLNPVSISIDTDFSDVETPFILFLTSILQTYSERSITKRIEIVQEAVTQITKVQDFFPEWKFPALGTLATLHYINEDYSSAREVFEEALHYSHKVRTVQTNNIADLLHNYIGTLMRLGLYEVALSVMDEYDEITNNHVKLALRFAGFRCFCYIFLGKPAEAFSAIPHESTHHVEYEHLYFRFIYVIIPYLNGDLETAHRESTNLQDYFDRHKETSSFPDQRTIALFLRRFFSVQLISPDKIKQKLQNLHQEIEEFSKQNKHISTLFLMIWLRGELQRKVT
ncbi:MAG: hypothetical protein HYZ54_06555 [Ignavibacteriae bacterium]|nr:hypothetical protein [Ignavibacteriota bacterium]